MTKRLSPFSREFWVAKGYSEAEADFKRNSMRPIRKEYWIKKGYTEKEAIEKVSKVQSTFSLEKCIKKHGEKRGKEIWQSRQNKWQNTLNNKTKEEKDNINFKRGFMNYKNLYNRFNGNRKEIFNCITKYRKNFSITIQQFENKIQEDIKKSPDIQYSYPKTFSKRYPKLQYDFLKIKNPENFILKFLKVGEIFNTSNCGCKNNFNGGYRKWTKKGLLRSGFEMYFYDLLNKYDFKFELEKHYQNSMLRCDFYLTDFDIYIEIAPRYISDIDYKIKMDKKIELFNCKLLIKSKTYEKFLLDLLDESKT